ncbi:MAG: DNA polymerase, partial [Eubacteriales bacterium]|nr:DNA polymerase [Eubacteriales bacterium]
MNSPIQGSAADLIKIAMLKAFRGLREGNFRSELVLQIHDELIIRTEKSEMDRVKDLLRQSMENAMDLKVALLCDMNDAYSWHDLKE